MADSDLTQGRPQKGKPKNLDESIARGLMALNLFGALSANEYARFVGLSTNASRSRLNNHQADGLVGIKKKRRTGGLGRPLVRFFLTEAGWQYAIESQLIDPARIGPYRPIDNETMFSNAPEHKTGVMATMIAVYLAAEAADGVSVEKIYSSYRPHPEWLKQRRRNPRPGIVRRETTMTSQHGGREIRVTSDATIVLSRGEGRSALFQIEYDRGRETIAARPGVEGLTSGTIEGKCRLFAILMGNGVVGKTYGGIPSCFVLFVTTNDDRIANMMSLIDWDALPTIGGQDPRAFFRFTTEDRARESFLGPIWRQPGAPDLLPLVNGA